MQKIKSLRLIFRELQEDGFIARTPENETVRFCGNSYQKAMLSELSGCLKLGNVINLLNVTQIDKENVISEFIILEPDYLVDISMLAECFRVYGHHPLNYIHGRLQQKEITPAMLLGNTANFFIDEIINADQHHPVDCAGALKNVFHAMAYEFTVCDGLKNPETGTVFFANCQRHFDHIRKVVDELFPRTGMDKNKLVVEPSFISDLLGLQGRLDVMSADFSGFIELKSGKAIEDYRNNGMFLHAALNHYTQMILYLAILEFNLDLNPDNIRSYLLYSKYPVLSKENHSRRHLSEALYLRNLIVANDFRIQYENRSDYTRAVLKNINSTELNTNRMSNLFFDNYLRPSIDKFQSLYASLNETEQLYIDRLYTFITKELWLSKVGEREYEGVKKASVLWGAPIEDIMAAGGILYDLKIKDNRAASESHDIVLTIPKYKNLYLPNFRPGDAVVLYERNSDADRVNNRQVFKGAIDSWDASQVKIRLRHRQKNPAVWNTDSRYAIMHDYLDTIYTGMFNALACFMEANSDRRSLLMGNAPKSPDEIFLLVGPPGTGKTSLALKQMVTDELETHPDHNILLLAYTNRAVDEICKALADITYAPMFVRLGNELNCDPAFRPHLLENQLKRCRTRSEVTTILNGCHIYAGTVASVWKKPELLALKQFELAIIDEATQLLESHLLGVLSIKTKTGENAIKRIVMIGDHKQLPAVVLQTKEESRVDETLLHETGLTNLSNSLFERLYHKYQTAGLTSACGFLSKQGRMHPDISEFPSRHFYEGRLETVGLPHQLETEYPFKRLRFHPVTPSGKDVSDKSNIREAEKAVAICMEIHAYCQSHGKPFLPQSVGIITPYRNQIALIRKCLHKSGIEAFSDILVDTVERFQGSQREIIIYSFCVKNEQQLHALPNILEENGQTIDRKLNVVLTRARKQLEIIGNATILNKNRIYSKLLEHIRQVE
ncbi:MAG: AAA family ATPase [Tannerella sp.]|jgi:hypothetical protein|nr:AAA family ATPase [Tannerella sp.]